MEETMEKMSRKNLGFKVKAMKGGKVTITFNLKKFLRDSTSGLSHIIAIAGHGKRTPAVRIPGTKAGLVLKVHVMKTRAELEDERRG
jgi:hypothetical protein